MLPLYSKVGLLENVYGRRGLGFKPPLTPGLSFESDSDQMSYQFSKALQSLKKDVGKVNIVVVVVCSCGKVIVGC
jgi:hypothetical protein